MENLKAIIVFLLFWSKRMDINLKVSPAELEAKATDFKGVMSQIKTLTDDMMADVTGLSSTWTGDASAAYISKFKKLQTDMDTMGRMINEHVTNLTNMAKDYTSTESSSQIEKWYQTTYDFRYQTDEFRDQRGI